MERLAGFMTFVELGGSRGTEGLSRTAVQPDSVHSFRDSALQRDMSLLFLRVAGCVVDKCISVNDGHLSNQCSIFRVTCQAMSDYLEGTTR